MFISFDSQNKHPILDRLVFKKFSENGKEFLVSIIPENLCDGVGRAEVDTKDGVQDVKAFDFICTDAFSTSEMSVANCWVVPRKEFLDKHQSFYTPEEVKKNLVMHVSNMQGCKATELAIKMGAVLMSSNVDFPKILEDAIQEELIVEVKYVLPNMHFRVKSFLLPAKAEVTVPFKHQYIS